MAFKIAEKATAAGRKEIVSFPPIFKLFSGLDNRQNSENGGFNRRESFDNERGPGCGSRDPRPRFNGRNDGYRGGNNRGNNNGYRNNNNSERWDNNRRQS